MVNHCLNFPITPPFLNKCVYDFCNVFVLKVEATFLLYICMKLLVNADIFYICKVSYSYSC